MSSIKLIIEELISENIKLNEEIIRIEEIDNEYADWDRSNCYGRIHANEAIIIKLKSLNE